MFVPAGSVKEVPEVAVGLVIDDDDIGDTGDIGLVTFVGLSKDFTHVLPDSIQGVHCPSE